MPRRTSLAVESLECRALLSALSASLTTDQTVYQAGQPITMTLTLTNTSDAPASFDYGPSFDGFIATQGEETVWQSNAGINPMWAMAETLQPGASFTLHATWNGTIASGLASTTTAGQFVVTNQLDPTGASATFTIESPLSYRLSASQSVVEFGQTIGFTYSITNNSDQTFTFNLAPTNFTVTGGGGTVWESDPGSSAPAPTSETLQPGQSITETAAWNGVANQGTLAGTDVWEVFNVAVAGSPLTASEEFQIESPLSQSVTTDQPIYQPGAAVQLTATETNVSDQAITLLNVNDQFIVMGLGGVSLPAVNASSSSPIVTLQPGQSQTFAATWDSSDAVGSTSIPSGSYTVLFQDNFQGTTSREFLIEGSSTNSPLPPGGPSPNPPLLPGGSSENPPPSDGSSTPIQNPSGIALILTTNHTTNPRREPLRIKITVKMTARTSAKLAADPSTALLTVQQGSRVIWTKSVVILKAKTLKPGQSLRLTEVWSGKPNVPGVKTTGPGLYTIRIDDNGTSASGEIRIHRDY
jgi:Intracellular proteinase inhibitor